MALQRLHSLERIGEGIEPSNRWRDDGLPV